LQLTAPASLTLPASPMLQHAWPAAPHGVHDAAVSLAPAVQLNPVLHTLPPQHASPPVPHAVHTYAEPL
jgi:hypothetical protein